MSLTKRQLWLILVCGTVCLRLDGWSDWFTCHVLFVVVLFWSVLFLAHRLFHYLVVLEKGTCMCMESFYLYFMFVFLQEEEELDLDLRQLHAGEKLPYTCICVSIRKVKPPSSSPHFLF